MEDFDDNIFDEDDALDYVLYEDSEKNGHRPQSGVGCLGILAVLILPASAFLKYATSI